MTKTVTRLYKNFQPTHYDLHLRIDKVAMTFAGSVTISGKKIGRPSSRLTFHQKNLKITDAQISKHDKAGPSVIPIDRINHHKTADEVRLHASQLLYPGAYTIKLEFEGVITRPMDGIYPCFFEHDGIQKQLIATQFESHHAREAFPCIDEPEAKATFDLTITHPNDETAVANTPVKKQTLVDGTMVTSFDTTPKMSTYLLAFVIGEIKYLEATTKGGVTVRTYATPDNIEHTGFALDTAVKCLDFFNDYFAIDYPLAKCDFIALPDFASGAMENWGCITFREHALLVDPQNTSLSSKQYVVSVVAHELAHQWFGNLVTMKWWDDLWLNESFASWISYLAVDQLYPEWDIWTQFLTDDQLNAFRLDYLENTHPIQSVINHPDEIQTIFDGISYDKGASVLQMLHTYLGPDSFRDGLRHYLKAHSYGNTVTTDLWASLETVSGKPVTEFMAAWTGQSGYPIIKAQINGDKINLTQERFYINPSVNKTDTVWPIPLHSSPKLNQDTMTAAKADLKIIGNSESWLLNAGRSGFYRIAYDTAHTEQLGQLVRAGQMAPVDRLGLLSDSFDAARAGVVPTVDTLKLLVAYADEDNCVVWDIIANIVGSIRAVMDNDELREALKPYVRQLTAKQLARLGWKIKPSESHLDSLLRPTILGLAAGADEPSVIKHINQQFSAAKNSSDIEPDFRGIIYSTVARNGGAAEYNKLLAWHNASSSSEDRVTIAAALTNFEQPELYQKALAMVTTPDVRLQDAMYWIAYSFGNRHAKRATWDWMVGHWQWLQDNLGSDLSFYRFPNYSARAFSDLKFLDEYTAFFESIIKPAMERPYKQGVETIQWQAAWKQRDAASILAFFS